jgi:hypothetical protein
LALFVSPKYHSPSSIRSFLHPNLYFGFHTEKKLTHFQVTLHPVCGANQLKRDVGLLHFFAQHHLLEEKIWVVAFIFS